MIFSGHIARKRFGQHWLKDGAVLEKILFAADLRPGDRVLEIGPGRGALTERLLDSQVESVHAIELDRDLVEGLRLRFGVNPRFTLEEGDVLSVPLSQSGEKPATKVVANIPYNITGPLLERLIGRLGRPSENHFKLLVLLVQKELAERIRAKPGDSSFSAMSVRLQLLTSCRKVCEVPPSCFQPPPKVQSEVIVLEPIGLEQHLEPVLARRVEALVNQAFLQRRKMLRNTIGRMRGFAEMNDLAKLAGISLQQRPQEVPPEAWVSLARVLNKADQYRG